MKARIPKGAGGGGDMNSMIRRSQKMMEQMEEVQNQLNEQEFTTSVGGGMVEIVMTGDRQVKQIKLNPEVVDPNDTEMLEDLIVAAFNQIVKEVETKSSEEMDKITGGLSIPGMI